jgi:hypothetical protein
MFMADEVALQRVSLRVLHSTVASRLPVSTPEVCDSHYQAAPYHILAL